MTNDRIEIETQYDTKWTDDLAPITDGLDGFLIEFHVISRFDVDFKCATV